LRRCINPKFSFDDCLEIFTEEFYTLLKHVFEINQKQYKIENN